MGRNAILEAERLTVPLAYHGEGPFWDDQTGRIFTMDVLAGVIVAVDMSGELVRYRIPSNAVTVMRRRASGGFIIATENGIIAADDKISAFNRIADITGDPTLRTNDGGCDPYGGFVVGTMAYDGQGGRGSVYRITPDHQVVELVSSVAISNGVQWSVDHTRAFYIDTPTKCIDVFDVDASTGAWSGRRPHILIESAGYPDGMAIDEEDGLWVALWGSGRVNHYDATGRLVETICVPGVTQSSSCAFGGSDRDLLYITTSRQGLEEMREPDAGALFVVHTRSRGAVQFEFTG